MKDWELVEWKCQSGGETITLTASEEPEIVRQAKPTGRGEYFQCQFCGREDMTVVIDYPVGCRNG